MSTPLPVPAQRFGPRVDAAYLLILTQLPVCYTWTLVLTCLFACLPTCLLAALLHSIKAITTTATTTTTTATSSIILEKLAKSNRKC
ncbi:hypothetical protein E2C01_039306 [Portunus trituberculatus]|uniref:Uncharacterized protein n=1 Tax=Portunus trituberculatus TaxID=210409 RepID=A0A5B7FGH7_PORTR|nr:hypothetical protein [Portunus trituberculatus]